MDGKTILPSMKTRKGPSTPSKTMKPNMNGAPGGVGFFNSCSFSITFFEAFPHISSGPKTNRDTHG